MSYYPPQDEKKRAHVIWKWIGVCVSVALITYGAVRLIGYLTDLHNARQTTQELREAAAEATIAELLPEEPGEVTVAPPEVTLLPPAETAAPEQQPAFNSERETEVKSIARLSSIQ